MVHMSSEIESHLSDGVLELVLSSEDGLNTIDDTWFAQLTADLERAAADRSVRAVLLSARGTAFCAGANLRGMAASDLHHGFAGSTLARLIDSLVSFAKPLLASVHGKAIGGGATLLLHCDLVAAAADSQFRFPFTSLGVVPELASSFLLPRSAGSRLASELLLLGKAFDAQTALRAGLVNAVVPAGEELALARQWAVELAALAPVSVQTTKRLLREGQHHGLATAIAREGEALATALRSGEVLEAVAAFLAKRRPDFSPFH
jgi:enoyl-CoA hydratase/carnithine racemase